MPNLDIEVPLIGEDGNVFNLISICVKAMVINKVDKESITRFKREVMNSGSYNNALVTIQKWVTIS